MRILPFRSTAPLAVALILSVAACGTQPIATPSPSSAPATAEGSPATADSTARAAYNAAICPIFDAIVLIDPRLAEMRALGAADGDVSAQGAELDALTSDLGRVLTDLEAVPTWNPGGELRFLMITALHAIRSHLLVVAEDPGAGDAAATLAATPFVASDPMDRAMSEAVDAGLSCQPTQ